MIEGMSNQKSTVEIEHDGGGKESSDCSRKNRIKLRKFLAFRIYTNLIYNLYNNSKHKILRSTSVMLTP